MQSFSTPMMKQYQQIKSQYRDCLLFYRMGDFYELFLEDAVVGSQILNITLTSRPKGKDGRIPMAGVPYHAVDAYLAKLVQAGFKVAICEQVSLPNKKGIIDREVIRVVTPGTVLDEKALGKKDNNFIISICIEGNLLGLSIADISTGYFATLEVEYENLDQTIQDELANFNPTECILSDLGYNHPELLKALKKQKGLSIFPFHDWENITYDSKNMLKLHFNVSTLQSFAVEDKPLALKSAAALLGYLQQTQKSQINHIKKIVYLTHEDCVLMDRSTMINLELFSTIREHNTKGSLLFVLDQTTTAMGGRMLKDWLLKPLRSKESITKRFDCVDFLLQNTAIRNQLTELLTQVNDIERVISRLSVGLGNARDLVNLKSSLQIVLEIKKKLTKSNVGQIKEIYQNISPSIQKVVEIIDQNIQPEPPAVSLKEGNLINAGINAELDNLRSHISGSQDWITNFEKQEKIRTGISSLKVRFNKVFGFYIEISKSNLHLAPNNYMRKQTLVNGERFITSELKKHEDIILAAEEKINDLEYRIFLQVLDQILQYTEDLQKGSYAIATLDCLTSFALLAEKEQYIRPKIIYSGELKIHGGRHPVVEKLLDNHQFVPNDIHLDNIKQQMLLITGPNMAGKSVLIRQVALIVLMAHIGCFVPAKSAHISPVDRIFVRSGASDVITSGLSTFMVEMVETANILHHATSSSLIIMDEIGRGTSTYDGISIAWAVAEYLASSKIPPKTLFATHYHELQTLEQHFPTKIKNYHMAVEQGKDNPIFLYTLVAGGASASFGIAVAKLAGIPTEVITKAQQMLKRLELRHLDEIILHKVEPEKHPLSNLELAEHLLFRELELIDLYQMTPIEALNKLAEIKNKIKLFKHNKTDFLQSD